MKAEISILKDGKEVATARRVGPIVLDGRGAWKGVDQLHCFYFPTLKLVPPVTFAHLAGAALIKFLDRSTLVIADEIHEPMRYVHGRSEVMKGKHTISAVLLAKVLPADLPELDWMSYLPEIYKRFMTEYDPATENA